MNALRPTRADDGALRHSHEFAGRDALVLIVVADRCGQVNGACTAGLKTLAATAGLSRASVQRSLAALEAAGFLERERRGRDAPDIIRLGPALQRYQHATAKRYQPETSQAEGFQSESKTSPPEAAEQSHVATVSTPLKRSVQALRPLSSGWPAVYAELEGAMAPHLAGTWLRPLEGYLGSDGALVVVAPGVLHADWLIHHRALIEHAVRTANVASRVRVERRAHEMASS
jgi:DNA-binding MarR family transcriptional regulator